MHPALQIPCPSSRGGDVVERTVLIRLAGTVWLGVGIGLIAVASWWINHAAGPVLPWVTAGIIGGVLVHRFKLRRLVTANLARIDGLAAGRERVRVLQFQSTRSYLVIALMIAMGYTLRHLPFPKIYLAPLYLAMGLGLFLAGISYFRSA